MIASNSGELSDKTFDFVIAGGGTAGLALAARLSEDPSVTVALLEAGENNIGDPEIAVPSQYGLTFGNPQYDWSFFTTKQVHSNNKEVMWPRGKGLGGSSTMNFNAWVKPPAVDVDAWEKLGNPGWNWADFFRYSKKAEKFHPPGKEQSDMFPYMYNASIRGADGPIRVTIPPHAHTVDALVHQTFVNMGINALEDAYNGDTSGTWIGSANIDPETWTRSYSATAYLLPSQDRPNLVVLTQALVTRIIFANDNTQGLLATGVEFIHQGTKHVVNARKEVILSAGTVKSPQILELSGVGRREVLSKVGIETKLDLPGVGENLQDHTFISVSYELDPVLKHETLDLLRDSEYVQGAMRLHAEGKGMLRNGITSFTYIPLSNIKTAGAANLIKKIEEEAEEYKNMPGIAPGLREQLDIQLATLHNDASPDIEIIGFPGFFPNPVVTPEQGKSYVSFMGIFNHPLSRGTIHVKSNDPQDNPEIDPHEFEKDTDLELLVQIIKYIRQMSQIEPLKFAIVGAEVAPGPGCATDEEIREYIKNTHCPVWHAIGTCSMLPREKQGVVDPFLKVYGTKNVRVVDISIVPLHIAAHTQTSAYMIAEKAADIIRSSCK